MAQITDDDFQVWNRLEEGIDKIMMHLHDGLSYEKYMELYTGIYNYCTISKIGAQSPTSVSPGQPGRGAHLMGGFLYEQLSNYLKKHLQTVLQDSSSHLDDSLLAYYSREWTRFTTAATYIHHVFRYLNRHWVKRELDEGHKNVFDVYTLHLVCWRDFFFIQIHQQLMNAILKWTERHRQGESVDTLMMKNIIGSFATLGLDETDYSNKTLDIYKKYFEEPFLQATQLFYKNESEKFLSQHTLVEYMKKCEVRLKEEEIRVEMYLNTSTLKPLISVCESTLIETYKDQFVEQFSQLLNQDKQEDLSRMYFLLNRIPNGLEPLKLKFEEHVKQAGLLSVEKLVNPDQEQKDQEVDPKKYVDSLLQVYKIYAATVTQSFKSDAGFIGSLDKACRDFVNRNALCQGESGGGKSPEYLAKYADMLLKKSGRQEEVEVEEGLQDLIVVFKYIEDKDIFQKFYSKMLAKRLVYDASHSEDAEASMISKLKAVCGFEYTSKLSRMFTDMSVSKDLNDSFKKKISQNLNEPLSAQLFNREFGMGDFYIKVLATGSWPLQPPTTTFNIPQQLEKVYTKFQQFYQQQHSGRKLTWLFHLSHGELKSNCFNLPSQPKGKPSGGYIIMVYTYAMAVFLCYNNVEPNQQGHVFLTFQQIKEQTGLLEEALNPVLALLQKARILYLQNNAYYLNFSFKSKKLRINLKISQKSEHKQELIQTHQHIEEDRKLLIQASIVRIMKTRKTMRHVLLVQEVMSQLSQRFKPKVTDIKKCLDILLEKEYLERVDGEKDMFAYLA